MEGWEPLWLVYTPPLTYKHAEGAEGAELIPGLAEALPEISADGKTYKFKLREGLKYSDGNAVKASDFEHTIKRVLNLESGGSSFYEGIEGADGVREGRQGRGRHLGHHGRRRDRRDHDQAHGARRHVPVRARDGRSPASCRATRRSRT